MTVLKAEEFIESPEADIKRGEALVLKLKKRSLWKIIAKNEIKIKTSNFRNHRLLLFIALYSFLLIWALVLAPYLFDLFMPTLADQFSEVFKPAVALIIESLMMTLFPVWSTRKTPA